MDLPTVFLTRQEILSLPKISQADVEAGKQGLYTSTNGQVLLFSEDHRSGAVVHEKKESNEPGTGVAGIAKIQQRQTPERLPDDHVERYIIKGYMRGKNKAKLTYSEAYDTILMQETWKQNGDQRFVRPQGYVRLTELNRMHMRVVDEMKRAGKL